MRKITMQQIMKAKKKKNTFTGHISPHPKMTLLCFFEADKKTLSRVIKCGILYIPIYLYNHKEAPYYTVTTFESEEELDQVYCDLLFLQNPRKNDRIHDSKLWASAFVAKREFNIKKPVLNHIVKQAPETLRTFNGRAYYHIPAIAQILNV